MSFSDQRDPSNGLGAQQRWLIYSLLIAVALGQAAGKILAVNSVDLSRLESYRIGETLARETAKLERQGLAGDELAAAVAERRETLEHDMRLQRPFLSANDRSRWMAIRAIAENGNHDIDPFLEEPTWDSIDMVQHLGRDGERHQYSSKPPLLMVLIAGPYWLLMQLTGTTLGESPYDLGRALLLLLNCGSLAVMLVAIGRIIERTGVGDIDRLFAMTVATFATQLAAFMPVLNNHLFGAAAAAVTCDLWQRLLRSDKPLGGVSLGAGLAAGFAVTCELPALALAVLVGLSLLWRRPGETLRAFAVGAGLVAVAFFATNYWAHDSLRPPYGHRSETDPADNWYDYEYTVGGKTRDSYWRHRQGIDIGEESKAVYALHTLVGHHGVFSMTPVWLLSFVGMGLLLSSRDGATRQLAVVTVLITAACLVFFILLRPQDDRNYGGATNGFRWLFWLAPLWIAMLPRAVASLRQSRVGMALAASLLAWSAMSASYPTWNPWTHPWIYRWMEHLGFSVL
ncbi:hypothetical protein Pla108_22920 [Botrimarina colliarenosi]|uniref:Glycosyltransferase RgtA/B/C/D-like domain-containing protein n=1 Tax=Botrimarina colliarenosi TaxID=2528001 RepID=A0A5C6AG22_9BACT|nr:hypothetical protein [Botrimarina colliarenosi]TWT98135.1 hypothetical protein Pla108_22920 [Botrimarina colliarenosi]